MNEKNIYIYQVGVMIAFQYGDLAEGGKENFLNSSLFNFGFSHSNPDKVIFYNGNSRVGDYTDVTKVFKGAEGTGIACTDKADLITYLTGFSGSFNDSSIGTLPTTLNSILSALQSQRDYEASLVLDNAGVTWLEIRIYDPNTSSFNAPIYYRPDGTTGTPVAPLSYINPNTYLASIVTNTTGVSRTPGLIRVTNSGTIALKTYDFSVSNVGSANGLILGQTIKPGETLNFGAGGVNNYYSSNTVSYDGSGTELLIIYNS